MRKIWFVGSVLFGVGLLIFSLALANAANRSVRALGEAAINDTPPSGTDIITSRQADEGIISTSSQSIFGPNICVPYGDPFSPWNSPWQPGPYTYQYRIKIPASYAYDVVRVELFDPDSMNQPENTHIITRTANAVSASLPLTSTRQCGPDGGSSNRKNPCILRTDEVDSSGTPVGGLNLDQVNPNWFVRVDENRGAGAAPGNGQCGSPANYNPAFNTATFFQLYYFRQNAPDVTERMNLAAYTGQTGDGVRDAGDHNTDLRWVSPGADAGVPVDAGSSATFEVDLTQDTPNIVTDTTTGDRYLYLDVTGLSGASDNNFEIWAGPPIYTTTVPSDVNARNVYLLNNPGAHDSAGVKVYALDYLPQDSKWTNPLEIPLVDLTAADAGGLFRISLYDSDAGSQPPVTFFIDTIPEGDWSMTFGATGVDDPDGVPAGVRCRPGSCSTQWVDPAYKLTLPITLTDGRLMARYIGGFSDSYGWQIERVVTAVPPQKANITGPITGTAGITDTFSAFVTPITVDWPLTYTWQIDGQLPIVHVAEKTTDNIDVVWTSGGDHVVALRVTNAGGEIFSTKTTVVAGTRFYYLPLIVKGAQ